MKRKLLLALIGLLPSLVFAEVYQWVDKNGTVHFGDKPPQSLPAEKLNVSNEKLGVKLSSEADIDNWKSANEEAEMPRSSAPISEHRKQSGRASSSEGERLCLNDRDPCFSEKEDLVCVLRWGLHCSDVYFWSVCEKKECLRTKNRRVCASPFYYLDRRPKSMNNRDLGRTFPKKGLVSEKDWQCLTRTGMFCDEFSDPAKCVQEYGVPCDELENWLAASHEKCRGNKGIKTCKLVSEVISSRPVSVIEQKRQGVAMGGFTLKRDLIMEEYGFKPSDVLDAAKADQIWTVLNKFPILSPDADVDSRLECDRRVDPSMKHILD